MPSKYYMKTGFTPDSCVKNAGLRYYEVADGISIKKGEVVNDNGSGYATNVLTAFDDTARGIAVAAADNTSGADGAISVAVIPLDPSYNFWVPNESGTVLAQTDIGETVDLESADGIDATDVTVSQWGFKIDKIDISTDALAVEDGGYAMGHFERQAQ